MDDVVEDFRGHVFWGSHGKLGNSLELEAGTIVDELNFSDVESFTSFLVSDQDVFSFEI